MSWLLLEHGDLDADRRHQRCVLPDAATYLPAALAPEIV
jgi:hypothetical protein